MNGYKIDEKSVKSSKFATMPRLFKYLLKYKGYPVCFQVQDSRD